MMVRGFSKYDLAQVEDAIFTKIPKYLLVSMCQERSFETQLLFYVVCICSGPLVVRELRPNSMKSFAAEQNW